MTSLRRILCAIDLEKASERAFERALSLAVISKARLYVLHAIPATVRFNSRSTERLRYLTKLRTRAEAAGVKARIDEQHGDPAGIIVLHANARKMDLVVMGSNKRRGWKRFREGSVSEAYSGTRRGPCSLFRGTFDRDRCASRPGVRQRPPAVGDQHGTERLRQDCLGR